MLHVYFALLLTATNLLPSYNNENKTIETAKAKDLLRVYQTPHEEGSLTVYSTTAAPLQFYLFDAEGKLIYQGEMKHRKPQTIEGLLPGAYTYHAFRADEKLKGGTIEIKN